MTLAEIKGKRHVSFVQKAIGTWQTRWECSAASLLFGFLQFGGPKFMGFFQKVERATWGIRSLQYHIVLKMSKPMGLLVWFQLWLHDLSVKICFPWAGFLGGCFSRTRPYESRHISCFVRQIGVKHSPLRRMMVPHVVEKGELLVRSAQPVFKWIEHRSSFNCGTWSFCHLGKQ